MRSREGSASRSSPRPRRCCGICCAWPASTRRSPGSAASYRSISPAMEQRGLPHSSHWGAFSVLLRDKGIEIVPHSQDANPSLLLGNIPASISHPARIARPMVRRGWLEHGPGPDHRRGRDELVRVSWPEALDLVATELRRVYAAHGPRTIFGGSYG